LPAFPQSGDHKDVVLLGHMVKELSASDTNNNNKNKKQDQYVPTPVDAPPKDRLAETSAARNQLCVYDEELQRSPPSPSFSMQS
jgi:hypothetical protein